MPDKVHLFHGGVALLKYSKFFDLLKTRGIKQIDLREKGIHPRTFQKLQNGDLIRSDTIDQLCKLLDCQPGDIMSYVPDAAAPQDTEEKK
ncbi:hypothetical protein SDC9_74042 [bioreactor metagenome]|uniref:HTH cro/C1-type domain-containing protein n=1 Tax=bioreactor metagenome TaxID=1076179 RepID=A0A644YGF1_9ZZZZ